MTAIKRFSKYGSVAVGSAVTDYTMFSVLLFLGTAILPAQMVARIAGGLFSFVLNKYWSFSALSHERFVLEGRRFLVLYVFSYLLALGILYVLMEHVGLGPYPAKITADVVCFMVNFFIMRRYVFSGGRGLRDRVRALIKSP